LLESILVTFPHRRTLIEVAPVGEPDDLAALVTEVRSVADPLPAAAAQNRGFKVRWPTGGQGNRLKQVHPRIERAAWERPAPLVEGCAGRALP